jgi:hypothetical protein
VLSFAVIREEVSISTCGKLQVVVDRTTTALL